MQNFRFCRLKKRNNKVASFIMLTSIKTFVKISNIILSINVMAVFIDEKLALEMSEKNCSFNLCLVILIQSNHLSMYVSPTPKKILDGH